MQTGTSRPARVPPRDELINVPEFEDVARIALDARVYATIAGGDRAAFERITFRPQLLVPTLDLDLSVDLFGDRHFAPILVGPVGEQRRFHAEGELATVRGAAAAQAGVLVSSRSSAPIAEIAAQAKTPLWFSVYADAAARGDIDRALTAGCKAVCITAPPTAPEAAMPWKTIRMILRGLNAPIIIKGVMSAEEARTALDNGARGIVVSDHGVPAGKIAPIEILASIVDAVAGRAAVLVDGSFRRGSDVAKALALGARAVLVARPAMWGLAAYGAAGVQSVVEILQSDLARTMAALGAANLDRLTRSLVRVDRW
jgi:4-hydroxymandelate oxidase